MPMSRFLLASRLAVSPRSAILALVAAALALPVASQGPLSGTLLRDINQDAPAATNDSLPRLLGQVGTSIWFSARSRDEGRELWVTDGTPGGTRLAADLAPGFASSDPRSGLALPNGNLLFVAEGAAVGSEPHVVSAVPGSVPGPLVDLEPGTTGSVPGGFVEWQGEAWFVATTAARGRELWRTDGTAAGTSPGGDLRPGPDSLPIDGTSLVVAGGKLYFVVFDQPQPTLHVKPFPGAAAQALRSLPRPDGSQRIYAVAVGSRLLFPSSASGAFDDAEPWVTDGTLAGTRLLADLTPGPAGTRIDVMAADAQRVWFRADTPAFGPELWTTDGTTARTRLVTDLRPGTEGALPYLPSAVLLPWGDLVFTADDGSGAGAELWRSDGTAAGTRMVADVTPGLLSGFPANLRLDGATVWFNAWSPATGRELWRYDALTGVTERMTDTTPGVGHGDASPMVGLGAGRMLFSARDPRHGLEPRIAGPVAGAERLLVDVFVDPTAGSRPQSFVRHRDHLFFSAIDPMTGFELWRTDGTVAGTNLVVDLVAGSDSSWARPFASLPAGLLFSVARGASYDHEIHVSDGTAAGTRRLAVTGGRGTFAPVFATQRVGDVALFVVPAPGTGFDLWSSDGTVGGTAPIPGWTGLTSASLLAVADDRAFGWVRSGSGSDQLLVSDGTSAGTQRLAPWPGSVSGGVLEVVGQGVVFAAPDVSGGEELWFAGGRPLVVQKVSDVVAGPTGADLRAIVSLGDLALFVVRDPATGAFDLWRTDGTTAGTRALGPGLPAGLVGPARYLTRAGSRALFWSSPAGATGWELWITDGSTAGTRRVAAQAAPGFAFDGAFLYAVGDGTHVAFRQTDPRLGSELWVSDGTAAGTRIVADSNRGAGSGEPEFVHRVADRLVFVATDAASGREPHGIPLGATGAWVASTYGRGCGAGIEASGAPTLGQTLRLDVASQPAAPTVLLFGARAAQTLLPGAAGACELLLDRPDTLASNPAGPGGVATFPLPVPNVPALQGDLLHFQAFAALAGGPILQLLASSPGVEVVIGR